MAEHHDIFDRLIADHRIHRDLLGRIGAMQNANGERTALFEEFTREAKAHASAEEQALYSTVLRKPALTDCGRHSVAEHHEIEELLNDLAATGQDDAAWSDKFGKLAHRFLHHIDEEEEEMFPRFAEVISDEDAVYMRQVFERRKPIEKQQAEVTPETLEDAAET